MMVSTDWALDCLDEAISWKLRPAINVDRVFDEIASKLRRMPAFKQLTIVEIDLALADLKREFAHDMREAEWAMYAAFRCAIGAE
jgi:hypothetical protein